jgi:hypothetical protein
MGVVMPTESFGKSITISSKKSLDALVALLEQEPKVIEKTKPLGSRKALKKLIAAWARARRDPVDQDRNCDRQQNSG